MKALVDAVLVITKSVEARLTKRLEALEQRQALAGPAGPPGDKGVDGKDGQAGEPGPRGEKGEPGPVGERGAPGDPGSIGPSGERGADGPEGQPGREGRDGLPGVQGPKGLDGKDGTNGKDGLDGLGFDDIQVEHDGERGFSFKFVQGDRVKTFGAFSLPVVIYRGLYEEGKSYERGDSVTWGGSMWVAKSPTTAKPEQREETSRAWQLAVQRGRDGKAGLPGPEGKPGKNAELVRR